MTKIRAYTLQWKFVLSLQQNVTDSKNASKKCSYLKNLLPFL